MNKRSEVLTQQRLRAVLFYNPDTGIWTWIARPSPWSRVKPGDVAGSKSGLPYVRIQLDGVSYTGHRLAWFWMTGEWPKSCDHKDTKGLNNKWSNIRICTSVQNGANRNLFSNNISGWKGVSWAASAGKWYSSIKVNRRSRNLGYFDCGPAAHFAYLIAADEAFGAFARGG